MFLIAHRGLHNDKIKENTLEAFYNAINNNYDGIELDIRLTKDNKIVALHDKYINRTSNGKGNINKLLYKELLKYNFGSKENKSKIPLLKEIITSINNTTIFIEIKEKINKNLLIPILEKNKSNVYYIMSFDENYIKEFINTKYKIGLINNIINKKHDKDIYNFTVILEDFFNDTIYKEQKNKDKEIVLYGLLKNISLKNKNILAKIKYIV